MSNRWGNSGNSDRLSFWGLQNHCKRWLLPRNLDSILNSRDMTLPTKVCLVKVMVFPVVMYGCESWTIKKAEYRRMDAFELWCWRRLLRVPWTAMRSNQSILKKISSEYSLEGLMLKLKLQSFGHLTQRTNSLEKTLMLGKIEGGQRRGWQMRWDHWMASLAQCTWVWASSRSWWWTGRPGVLQSTGSQRVGHDWATELSWTDSQLTVVIVPGGQQRDPALHIHVSILPQTPLPSRLPYDIEQSSLCYTALPWWLSILNIAVCTCSAKAP